MAVRQTGFALLAVLQQRSGSHGLRRGIAHLAAIKGRVPFLTFL